MSITRIAELLRKCANSERNFPATDLYNEGWMLRLALDWFSLNQGVDHDFAFNSTDRWYSEALLPSAFLARVRGDSLAESWTHADGVIGDIMIGANRDGDLTLTENGTRMLVIEAKMFSKLSAGVKNASYYNQAARNIGCIAETIRRAGLLPGNMQKIGFFVVAPKEQIGANIFTHQLEKESVKKIVLRRVSEYQDQSMDIWYKDSFLPTLDNIHIKSISWEEIVDLATSTDTATGSELSSFYDKCLEFNRRGPKPSLH